MYTICNIYICYLLYNEGRRRREQSWDNQKAIWNAAVIRLQHLIVIFWHSNPLRISTEARWPRMNVKKVPAKCLFWALEVVTVIQFIKINNEHEKSKIILLPTKRIRTNRNLSTNCIVRLFPIGLSWIQGNPDLISCNNRPFLQIFSLSVSLNSWYINSMITNITILKFNSNSAVFENFLSWVRLSAHKHIKLKIELTLINQLDTCYLKQRNR